MDREAPSTLLRRLNPGADLRFDELAEKVPGQEIGGLDDTALAGSELDEVLRLFGKDAHSGSTDIEQMTLIGRGIGDAPAGRRPSDDPVHSAAVVELEQLAEYGRARRSSTNDCDVSHGYFSRFGDSYPAARLAASRQGSSREIRRVRFPGSLDGRCCSTVPPNRGRTRGIGPVRRRKRAAKVRVDARKGCGSDARSHVPRTPHGRPARGW